MKIKTLTLAVPLQFHICVFTEETVIVRRRGLRNEIIISSVRTSALWLTVPEASTSPETSRTSPTPRCDVTQKHACFLIQADLSSDSAAIKTIATETAGPGCTGSSVHPVANHWPRSGRRNLNVLASTDFKVASHLLGHVQSCSVTVASQLQACPPSIRAG